MEKEQKNGLKNAGVVAVRTVFNDEEQRRYVDIYMLLVTVYTCNSLAWDTMKCFSVDYWSVLIDLGN